jgi:hypothetical protein
MRFLTSCMQCLTKSGLSKPPEFIIEHISESGLIKSVCSQNHESFIVIQDTKYEILSYIAVTALHDGYYREAVMSFYSALERLYEHYIEIVCCKRGIDYDEFCAAWNPIKKLSERQTGAFAFTHLIETGNAYQALGNKYTELRNQVAHNGKIPTLQETTEYGQAIGDYITPLIKLLHSESYVEAQMRLTWNRVDKRAEPVSDQQLTTLLINTPFSIHNFQDSFDIHSALASHAQRPEINFSHTK